MVDLLFPLHTSYIVEEGSALMVVLGSEWFPSMLGGLLIFLYFILISLAICTRRHR